MGRWSRVGAVALAVLAAWLLLAAPGAEAAERRMGRVEIIERTGSTHPYARQLRDLVLSTMTEGTLWGEYRDPEDGRRYVGHDACVPCHYDRHQTWAETKMARSIVTLADFKSGAFLNDPRCLSCHTTGYDPGRNNGGFDDGAALMADVQCEACHGAGSLMVERTDRRYITRSGDARLCGRCHSERYGTGLCFPEYDEWKVSRHAVALDTLRSSSEAVDACLGCHSVDAIAPRVGEQATLQGARNGISCQACHDPMQRTYSERADNNQLRKPKAEMCQWCHSERGTTPGDLPHAPQGEMFAGVGGAEFPGEEYRNGPMNPDLERGCLTCHAVSDRSIPTPYQGHTFLPNILACRRCHPDLGSFDRKGVQGTIRRLLISLEKRLSDFRGDPESDSYQRARYNYAFVSRDRSLGIHNTDYARKLLVDSLRALSPSGEQETY